MNSLNSRRADVPSATAGSAYNADMGTTGTQQGKLLPPFTAPVTPRAHEENSKANLPLESLVESVFQSADCGMVTLLGPPGSGRSIALQHLQAVLPTELKVTYLDVDQSHRAAGFAMRGRVVVAAETVPLRPQPLALFQLSRWTLDDCLQYLATLHRDQCKSVYARLKLDSSLDIFNGSPQLLSLIMDSMAQDETLLTGRDACRNELKRIFDDDLRRALVDHPDRANEILNLAAARWWRHEAVRTILRAEEAVEKLARKLIPSLVTEGVNEKWIGEIAAIAKNRPEAIETLERIVAINAAHDSTSMAASILLAMNPGWRPRDGRKLHLKNAILAGAKWQGMDLTGAQLSGANLSGADLSNANLNLVKADGAQFDGATLVCARMTQGVFQLASFESADLTRADLTGADCTNAGFGNSRLVCATMGSADLTLTDLERAICHGADFSKAILKGTLVDGADFAGAGFTGAILHHVKMSDASWVGAVFADAQLHHCNLEDLEMPGVNFARASLSESLLTGSRMPGANFHGASLCRAGLAEIDWEGADLRDADFGHAAFHLGSSRSGLVGSDVPCEGSKTGFYTDEFMEQSFKAPEEIRKANLARCNLLGAKVDETDFYLVDLRWAEYTEDQRDHFAKCRAILDSHMT